MISDSIDIEKVKVLVNNLHSSEEEDGEESTVKLPKTFEERKQLGMAYVALNAWDTWADPGVQGCPVTTWKFRNGYRFP